MREYCGKGTCIGEGPAGTSVVLDAGTPSAVNDPSSGPDDAGASGGEDLQTLLQGLMASGAVPAPDANTIYTLYLPDSVTFNGTSSPCENLFEGYHSEGTYNGTNYVYAIVIECADTPIASLADNTTETAAHEIAESASDGFSNPTTGAGGYYIDFNDPNTWAWNDDEDGEIADLCVDYYNLGQDKWVEGSYTYQRIWSVAAAAANQNPCHPIPAGEVYFNAAPASAFLEANVGETITIEVDAFSDAPRGEWALLAQDTTDPTGAATYTSLAFEGADGGAGQPVVFVNNGSKPKLSITLTADPSGVGNGAAANYAGEADVTLWSFETPDGGADYAAASAGHYWELAVMTRGEAQDAGVTLVDGAVPLDLPHEARPLRAPRPGMRPKHVQGPRRRPGFTR
jgi:hypothetical protein